MGNANEIEELLSPQIGLRRRNGAEYVPSFRSRISRAIERRGLGFGAGKKVRSRRGVVAVREPNARSRRCVVKVRYVLVRGNNRAAKLHLAYLVRDGVERDGTQGKLYGPDAGFTPDAFDQPLAGEQRQFRFIVSPEDGDRLDLTAFARQFMGQVEQDVGRRLVWAAVNHHNTDNPHVHIVVRGVDADGEDLRIDGRYIGQELRWRAQEIATRELGPRTELEVERGRSKEVTREAFTPIDRMLAGHLSANRLAPERLAGAPRAERASCLARLAVLEQMGIARRETGGAWELASDWDADLKRMEVVKEVRVRLARHVPGCVGQGQLLDAGQAFETVEGVVRGLGLHDELSDARYIVVERAGGGACYVAVRPEVAAGLAAGDVVKISSPTESWVKPTDRIVVRFAADHGGVYDPVAHQAALAMRAGREGDRQQPTSAELVGANLHRLERLERFGLVARETGGRWRVPPDLLVKLEAREKSHPRHRIAIVRLGPDRPLRRKGAEVSR
jgi:type IV secretory pathway VirD2 relaxase